MKTVRQTPIFNLPVVQPNPQGKGLRPVLDSLNELKQVCLIQPKNISQISTELFTSLFILESQIRFKPVLEKPYWLYLKNSRYHLSLIHPMQWSSQQAGDFIGECQLHTDLTWSLALSDAAMNNLELMNFLNCRRQQFEQQLAGAEKLQDTLPNYVSSFSYYSRVLASGLAFSLSSSMQLSGIADKPYLEALELKQPILRKI